MLQGICMNYAIQTTKVLRLAVRKDRWLITEKHWKEEIEEYEGYLKAYIKDFSRGEFKEASKSDSKGELTALFIGFLKEEIEEMALCLHDMRMTALIEKFEMCLSLAYGILLSIHEKKEHVSNSLFPLTKDEMSWYINEYSEKKNMPLHVIGWILKEERIA